MTTKDQAIAPKPPQIAFEHYWIKTRNQKKSRHELQRHPLQPQTYVADNANRHWVTWQAAQAQAKQPPAPDCRTCEYMWIDVDLEKATSKESCARSGGAVCINGSLHKPAPKVVLWRTE